MRILLCGIALLLLTGHVMAKEYHVSSQGSDANDGSVLLPLKTINYAAQKALSGDTVTVHGGVYREWVNPLNGGESDDKRILYRVLKGERAELKGSELIKNWTREKKAKGVWKVTLSNTFFGNYNPYHDPIFGDWFYNNGQTHHTGDVYLNDVSFYEAKSLNKVFHPDTIRSIRDPEGTTNFWFATVDVDQTTIYVHFGNVNPNQETVEIAVRPTCFYPTREGLNFITIQGFHIGQAATQWGAPTAEQVGMVATHWCKGWIIEDNVIKNSRCSGITLGKERSTGHNLESTDPRLDGSFHYIEVIFNTLRHGWNRDYVGSHIVRNNVISDCEQTGICGSMGGAFSQIYNNHIYNIWAKRQFGGAEMAGIKLHGAIDTYIHHNRIHNCGYAVWLDWMAQGARVSSNLFYRNTNEDLFTEVDHGPIIVDNNLFLSSQSIRENSDGIAYLHNLFAGNINRFDDSRYTPYHLKHSTEVKGIRTTTNGDHRFYNNIFIGGEGKDVKYGLCVYDAAQWPIYAEDNLFCNGSKPMVDKQQGIMVVKKHATLQIEEIGDGVYFSFSPDEELLSAIQARTVDTARLGKAKLSGHSFENADGTPFFLDKDYFGTVRSKNSPVVGPMEITSIKRMKIW